MKNKRKIIIISLIVLAIIVLRLVMYFTSLKPKDYLEENNIITDAFIENFKLKNLLFNLNEETNEPDYNISELVDAEYVINDVNIEGSTKDNYRKIVIDYVIKLNGYYEISEDGTIKNMNYIYFNPLTVYDAYTGKMLNMKSVTNDGVIRNSMNLTWINEKYTIYQTRTIKINKLGKIEQTANLWYYPMEINIVEEIEMPIGYNGLLLGFNSLKEMTEKQIIKSYQESKKEYYILDNYNSSLKLFKVGL